MGKGGRVLKLTRAGEAAGWASGDHAGGAAMKTLQLKAGVVGSQGLGRTFHDKGQSLPQQPVYGLSTST